MANTQDSLVGVQAGVPVPAMRYYLYGYYGGFAADWKKNAVDIKNSIYDGTKLHIMDPWGEKLFPWPKLGGGYDLRNTLDPAWLAKMDEVAESHAENDLFLDLCLFDIYFKPNFILDYPAKGSHPFVSNNIGIHWSLPQALYNDFDWTTKRQTYLFFAPKQAPSQYTTNAMGDAIHKYISAVGVAIKKAKKAHPTWTKPVKFRGFNEQVGEVASSGPTAGHVISPAAYGEVNEIEHWMEWVLGKAGLVKNVDYVWATDWKAWIYHPNNPAWPNLKNAFHDSTVVEQWLHEVHGINSVSDIAPYLQNGFDISHTQFSEDGKNERDSNYFGEASALWHYWLQGHIQMLDDKGFVPHGWNPLDMQYNFDHFFRRHEAAVKTGVWK